MQARSHEQAMLWPELQATEETAEIFDEDVDLSVYDRFLVFFSGGKDSLACLLHLMEMGVQAEKIELHHHLVDGREGSTLMDWPVTEAYCEAVAKHFGVKLTLSWRRGGFEAEMNRKDAATAPVCIPDGTGGFVAVGGNGPLGTRLKFPQVSANLSVRWCSSSLKIDTGARYLTNDEVFTRGKTLVLTGERAQESKARSKYRQFEAHRCDLRTGRAYQRHIDHWRPIHQWDEAAVWEIIKRWGILAHPAYHLGWGRTSCRQCIFGSKNQWATVRAIAPEAFQKIAVYEREFGVTIHRSESVVQRADAGVPYALDHRWIAIANSKKLDIPVHVADRWEMPLGAFGESCGPT